MNSFGKKILSAFVDIRQDEQPGNPTTQRADLVPTTMPAESFTATPDSRFANHFDKLFADTHLPGPGYYEFSKMIAVMQAIPDEKARYCTAFAGLQVQGLGKQQLLASVQQYLQIVEDDTTAFQRTISAAFKEKVGDKREAVENAKEELQLLSQQIIHLQEQIAHWTAEIAENETKIQHSNSGYNGAMEDCKKRLLLDVEKINHYII